MSRVEVDVAGHEQVQLPVAVVIPEGAPGGPSIHGDAGRFAHVGERPVVVVVIEPIAAVVGDVEVGPAVVVEVARAQDRKSTRLNSSHSQISYAVFCLKKKKKKKAYVSQT